MTESTDQSSLGTEPAALERFARDRPDLVMVAPYMAYLLFMMVGGKFPEAYLPWGIALRGVGGFTVFWLFRKHLPALGKPHLGLAIVMGVLCAAGWVAGQKLFDAVGLGGRFFLFPGVPEADDPRVGISAVSWWSQAVLRIGVASVTVPIVEELFWRGFLLRALIDWHRFEKVPLGTFTWVSFLGTSLLSMLQHPDNWAISVLCWFAFNALMYWKKSLLFLMIVHGVTNLALYVYVIAWEDWLFW